MLSDSIIKVLEIYAIDYKPEVELQEEGENNGIETSCIEEGEKYSYEVDLLVMQLRVRSQAEKQAISERLTEEINKINPSTSDLIAVGILKAYASQKRDGRIDWSQFNKLLNNLELHEKVIYGTALSMIRDNNAEGALNGIKRLLSKTKNITPNQKFIILSRFLTTYCDCFPVASDNFSSEEWGRFIQIHLIITKIIKIMHNNADELISQASSKYFARICGELELVKALTSKPPEGICNSTWNLMLNIHNQNNDPDAPKTIYLESKSLPRSGHHYLKSILQHTLKDNLSYCEGYQEPGCCKSSPCANDSYWKYSKKQNLPHWRLVKSHDFDLTDMAFDPTGGMFRFIQIRRPFEMLISWLELQQLSVNKALLEQNNIPLNRIFLYHEPQLIESSWEVIDNAGRTFTKEETENWLNLKAKYIMAFSNKWLPLSHPIKSEFFPNYGNYIINYEELADPSPILLLLGIEACRSSNMPTFHSKRESPLLRKSEKVTEMIAGASEILYEYDELLMSKFPSLADGSDLSF